MKKTSIQILLGIALILCCSASVMANWTASGRFVYVDREFNETGFTGTEPQVPMRFADVEVFDTILKKNAVLASGSTDENGYYSINVPDTKVRSVAIRVITSSTRTPDLFVSVKDKATGNSKLYSVKTNTYASHNPNTSINAGTYSAAITKGGEAFNIFDSAVKAADYVRYLSGARPGSDKSITYVWATNNGITNSSYSYDQVLLRDTAGYDDTVMLHEFGHHVIRHYSASSSPGGNHTFTTCNQDIRLAFAEGFADFFAGAVRAYHGIARSNVYMRTDGGAGPGHIVRWFNYETKSQVSCDGDNNEVRVANCLWDIMDGPSTPDFDTGSEESHDLLTGIDDDIWEVMTSYIPTAASISLEDFWDGWFSPGIVNGYRAEMEQIFAQFLVEFFPDIAEGNNSVSAPYPLVANGTSSHFTFFSDPERDGFGTADNDYFSFQTAANSTYAIETLNLISDGNTSLELYDTDGITVLASNDNRASGNESSYISWTAPRADTFYIRVFHAPDNGIYGSYDLKITP
jgi:hypothetical protein